MKKRIDVIAGETAYNNLSEFKELEELNKTVRVYRDIIRTSINRVDVRSRLITLLELLKRHSCKQLGVSYMCKNTIASLLDVSYKTVQRLMKKLEEMSIIKQVAMKRKNDMRQTANAIIILPNEGLVHSVLEIKEEVSDKTTTKKGDKCPTNKTTSISLKQKIKNIRNVSAIVNKSVDSNNPIDFYDYTYVSSNVPTTFIEAVRPFFNDSKDIYRLWSRMKLAANKSNVDVLLNVDSFVKTFKEAILNIKKKWNCKDMIGYIYGAWRNTAAELSRKQNGIYNWLDM